MNRHLSWLALLGVLSIALTALSAPPRPVAIAHVTVVDVRSGRLLPNQSVLLDGDRIISVGLSADVSVAKGALRVEASGKYLVPGLWDAHVHLTYLGRCAIPIFVANGVTSVRDAGSRLEDIAKWRADIGDSVLLGPRIKSAGPNLESVDWLERAWKLLPAEHPAWKLGPRLPVAAPEQAAEIVESVAHLGADFIKFRNLPRASFKAIAAAAKRRGLPLAGHAPHATSLTEASEAGMKSIEHAETVMLALGALPEQRRLGSFRLLAQNGTLVTPTLVADVVGHLTPDSEALSIVADANGTRDARRKYISAKTIELWRLGLDLKKRYGDPPDWSSLYRREIEDMRLAHSVGVKFMAGTDVGGITGLYPGFGLHDELELLVKKVGLTPLEALQSATTIPPTFFRRKPGIIEPGNVADLVLLDSNPLEDIANTRRIRAVIIGGRVLQREDLDALLSGIAEEVRDRTGCASEED